MSFNVRIFAYSGVVTAPLTQTRQNSADSVFLLKQPYLPGGGQKLPSNGATPVLSTATPSKTKLLRVEIDDGNSIRYELWPNGTGTTPSTNSPILTGRDQLDCGEGYVFAFVDASAV